MTSALIIVDMQCGFATDGAALPDLADRIARFVRDHREAYRLVVATRFRSERGSIYERLIGDDMKTPEEIRLLEPIASLDVDLEVERCAYAKVDADVADRLRELGVTEVHLCGADTDQCVLATALAAFDQGFEPAALVDLCHATSGRACHDAGILALRRALGPDRVVSSVEAMARHASS